MKNDDKHSNTPEAMFGLNKIAEAICGLTSAINAGVEQKKTEFEWVRSHHGFATKIDLIQMEKRIMATQAEVIQTLKDASASLKQVNIDIKDTQTKMDALNAKIVELQDIINAGGAITPELVDAANEVKALAGAADEALPNPVVVPPPV